MTSPFPQETWQRASTREAHYLKTGEPSALDEAITLWEGLLAAPDAGPTSGRFRQATRTKLGGALLRRYQGRGDVGDLDRALAIWQEALDQAHAGEVAPAGHLLNLGVGLGVKYERTGDLEDLRRSIAMLERARRAAAPEFSALAALLSNLGSACRMLYARTGDPADLDEAVQTLEAAVEKAPSPSAARPGSLTSLGLARADRYDRTGSRQDLEAAVQLLEEALAATPPEAPEAALRRSNLGMARAKRYARTGELHDLAAAVDLFEAALQATPATSPARPIYLANLGVAAVELSRRTGDPTQVDAAIRAFTAAVEAATPDSPHLPLVLEGVAAGLSRRHEITGRPEDLAAAIPLFRQALARSPRDAPSRPRLLANLAASLQRRQAPPGDLAVLDETIRLSREALARTPTGSPDLPRFLHNLAVSLRQRYEAAGSTGDRDEAAQAFRRSALTGLDIALEVALGSGRAWGDWASQRQDWGEAAEAYGLARQAVARLVEIQLVQQGRASWLRDAQALASHEAYARFRAGDLAGAVLAIEEGSARLLAGALDLNGSALSVLEGSHSDLVGRFREAAERLSAVERGWAMEGRPAGDPQLAHRVRSLRAELASITAEVRSLPGFESFFATPTIEDIRRAVAPADDGAPEALLYLATSLAGSVALLVSAERLEAMELDLTGPGLAHLLEGGDDRAGYLPGLLSLDPEANRHWLGEALSEILPAVGTQVTDPLAVWLRGTGIERIVLVPTGPLAILPLHAVGAPALIEEFVVSYVPNARALAAARQERSRRRGALLLVGVGDPLPSSRPLPGARAELEAVASLFAAEERSILYGEAATRAALLESLPRGTHLHFACHGHFDTAAPLASGLELSGGATLTLRDLLAGEARPERARLAVLSACQTAVRDLHDLPDELISLPAGFLAAGVPGVVGTIWPVTDLPATLCMVRFYYLLVRGDPEAGPSPLEPADALRRAQLWLRDLTVSELESQLERSPELSILPSAAAAAARSFCMLHEDPGEKLFSLRDWAPFLFLGI